VTRERAAKSIRFITRDDHKLYIHPETGEFIPGVTSTIDNIPKPFLKAWGQKLVAEEAVAKLPALTNLAAHDAEGAVDWLKRAPNRFTAKAAKVGHEAHGLFEELSLGNAVGEVPDYLRPYEYHFKDYLDTLQPEFLLLEEGVWDEEHGYAGTFDAIVRYSRPDIEFTVGGQEMALDGVSWQDSKTTKSGVHAEVSLQLSAYRHARWLLRPDGTCVPNRAGELATVLHVRPEGWQLVPVRAGLEDLEFFHVLQKINGWRELQRNALGQAVAGNREVRPRRAASREPKVVAE
jgi:hypothetical protein